MRKDLGACRTPEELASFVAQVEKLRAEGLTLRVIGMRLGVTPAGIYMRMKAAKKQGVVQSAG